MTTAEKTYIQGGAEYGRTIRDRTKSKLKQMIEEQPNNVYLYDTSAFGSKFSGPAPSLPKDVMFNVVGPDPYSKRDWYATVYWGRDGVLKVK